MVCASVMDDGTSMQGFSDVGDIDLRCIGFGTRGADAIKRLVNSQGVPSSAQLWCLDTDQNILDGVNGIASTIVVGSQSGGPSLTPEYVRNIVGRMASDAGGQGNIGKGDGGLAFLLAPSAGIPGGPETLLQMTHALRSAGHFTVVAVVSPFDFEGANKKKQSNELVGSLRQLAHVVAVLDQDVLLKQSYGDDHMTVAESTEIANAALEHTVKCVLRAVCSKEILKSSQGGLMWHGKELRHFKRLISPPLQQLLTRDGQGALGRGIASLPFDAVKSMGLESSLMHVSSDAVRGAAESPFVEGVLPRAAGVLCCIRVPDESSFGSSVDLQAVEKSYRMAAQACAGALRTISGKYCDDFVVYIEKYGAEDSDVLSVEVTLLVLWSPENGYDSPSKSWKESWGSTAESFNSQNGETPAAGSPPPKAANSLPSSSWGMLSAIAGGEASESGSSAPNQKRNTVEPSKQEYAVKVKRPEVVKPTKEERERYQQRRKEKVTVGDYLAESLTAQSLDLPPAVRFRSSYLYEAMWLILFYWLLIGRQIGYVLL